MTLFVKFASFCFIQFHSSLGLVDLETCIGSTALRYRILNYVFFNYCNTDLLVKFIDTKLASGELDELFATQSKKIAERGRVTIGNGQVLSPGVQEEISEFSQWTDERRRKQMEVIDFRVRNMVSPQSGQLYKKQIMEYQCSGDVLMHVCQKLLKDFEGKAMIIFTWFNGVKGENRF